MKKRNSIDLKEQVKHGDALLPLKIYINTLDSINAIMFPHWHDEFEITYIKSGKALFSIDLVPYTVSEGDILIIPSQSLHSAKSVKEISCVCHTIVLNLNFLKSFNLDSNQIKYISPISNNKLTFPKFINKEYEIYEDLLNCFKKIIYTSSEAKFGFELWLKSLLFEFFAIMIQNFCVDGTLSERNIHNKNVMNMKSIIKHVNENYHRNISISEISKLVGYSEYHFCRFFKRHTGQTFVEYINAIKINKACYLLLNTNMSISEIAYEVGFNDLSYFIRIFEKKQAMTPTQYRRN